MLAESIKVFQVSPMNLERIPHDLQKLQKRSSTPVLSMYHCVEG